MKQVVLLLVLLLIATDAHADAVAGPPADCPPGSLGNSDHTGEWCSPTTCVAPDKCKQRRRFRDDKDVKFRCAELGLCVEKVRAPQRGRIPNKMRDLEIARSVCQSDADCIKPSTCVIAQRCVAAGESPTAQPEAGKSKDNRQDKQCGCTVPGAPADSAGTWLLLMAIWAATKRRRGT